MKEISIVIVTWNCKKFAEKCLDSLSNYRNRPDVEIIVVDNASVDGTPDFVQERYPDVNLIRSKKNLGFTKGNNLGIRQTSGKYLCLINPDVEVEKTCIEKMRAYLEKNPRVGLLGPLMIGPDGKPYRSSMGAPTLWNMFCRAIALDVLFPGSKYFGGFLMTYFTPDRIAEVDILTGWFWMTRREALDGVGLLDENLFMYGDDLDWSKRFKDAGWKVVFFPEAESLHYGGGTTAKSPVKFSVEMQRANFQYWQKNHGRLSHPVYLFIMWLHQAVRVIGYFPMLAAGKAKRGAAIFKLKRSFACMLWAMGLSGPRGMQAR